MGITVFITENDLSPALVKEWQLINIYSFSSYQGIVINALDISKSDD